MGLKVAAHKTEAMFFYGRASGVPPETRIRVGGTSILVGDRIRYLGLLLDGKWRFEHHFSALALRVERVSAALGRPAKPRGTGWSCPPHLYGHG